MFFYDTQSHTHAHASTHTHTQARARTHTHTNYYANYFPKILIDFTYLFWKCLLSVTPHLNDTTQEQNERKKMFLYITDKGAICNGIFRFLFSNIWYFSILQSTPHVRVQFIKDRGNVQYSASVNALSRCSVSVTAHHTVPIQGQNQRRQENK